MIDLTERDAAANPHVLRQATYAECLEWADGNERRLLIVARARGYRRGWVYHAVRTHPQNRRS